MVLAGICVVWSKSPLGAMLILVWKLLKVPHVSVYVDVSFLDNGDPMCLLHFSNLHTIYRYKNRNFGNFSFILKSVLHLIFKYI